MRRLKFSAQLSLWSLLFLCCLTTESCENAQNEYSIGVCFLVIENNVHQNIALSSAMNINAPGTFCRIKREIVGGASCFDCETNNGMHSEPSVFDAYDQRRTVNIGYNNGVIVGFGALDVPPVFYAFDNECPNCFDPQALPVRSKPLSMNSAGIATCAVCHREYNMNSGGNIVKGDSGKKLTRYRASTTGPYGVLTVN